MHATPLLRGSRPPNTCMRLRWGTTSARSWGGAHGDRPPLRYGGSSKLGTHTARGPYSSSMPRSIGPSYGRCVSLTSSNFCSPTGREHPRLSMFLKVPPQVPSVRAVQVSVRGVNSLTLSRQTPNAPNTGPIRPPGASLDARGVQEYLAYKKLPPPKDICRDLSIGRL